MKLLLLTVIIFSAFPERAESNGGFGYELTMAVLEGMQTNSIAMEDDLKSVVTKVDRLMDDQRLSTKIDSIMEVLSKLTEKLAENTRTATRYLDGVQNNVKALENDLEAISTKVSYLASRVDQIVFEQSKFTEIFNVNSKKFSTKLDRIMDVNVAECPPVAVNGVYQLKLSRSYSFPVYCEEGWIVIHRRIDGSQSFDKMWNDFRDGFGNIRADFWMGLEKMHRITREGSYELKVIVKDFDGEEKRATYRGFTIASKDEQYRLNYQKFIGGDAGDSLAKQKGMLFSSLDRDNDTNGTLNCAKKFDSSWWFNGCFHSNLNGGFGRTDYFGMVWMTFDNIYRGMKEAQMMIRAVK